MMCQHENLRKFDYFGCLEYGISKLKSYVTAVFVCYRKSLGAYSAYNQSIFSANTLLALETMIDNNKICTIIIRLIRNLVYFSITLSLE
jgi:hypothetical protein